MVYKGCYTPQDTFEVTAPKMQASAFYIQNIRMKTWKYVRAHSCMFDDSFALSVRGRVKVD